MRHDRIRILQNVALVAAIVVALGARTSDRPAPMEVSGEANGNVVALSVELPDGASDIVLLVDEAEPGSVPDGRVDRGFVLQRAGGAHRDLVLDLAYARVRWDSRRLGVWQSGSELLEFRVSEELPDDEATIVGFGLSHSSAWDVVRIPVQGPLAPELLAGLRTDVAAALAVCEEFDCRAGGRGVLGCSYSCGEETCSVTCMNGFKPCCGCGTDGKPCCRCDE